MLAKEMRKYEEESLWRVLRLRQPRGGNGVVAAPIDVNKLASWQEASAGEACTKSSHHQYVCARKRLGVTLCIA